VAALHLGFERVEDAGTIVALEIGGNQGQIGVAQNALKSAFAGGFHGGVYRFFCCFLVDLNHEIHERNHRRWDANRDAVHFPFQSRNHKADGFGGSGGRGEHVERSRSCSAKVLVIIIMEVLIVGVSMNGRHQTALDSKIFMQHFCHWSESVGGATGVGNNKVGFRIVVFVVHAHHHGAVDGIFGGS